MAEVTSTVGASNLCSCHTKRVVSSFDNVSSCCLGKKTRPATMTVKLLFTVKQLVAASSTGVDTWLFEGGIAPCKGEVGSFFAKYPVLLFG